MKYLYNIEHYGGLLTMICLRMTYHKEDTAILLVSQNNGKEELHQRLLKANIFDKILVHKKGIGMKSLTENEVSESLLNYYDDFFSDNDIDLEEIVTIYTSHDCDNTFGTYLALKNIMQTIVEILPDQCDKIGTYETTVCKGISSRAYADVQKKMGVLCGEGKYCKKLRCRKHKTDNYFQYYDLCKELTKEDKIAILKALVPDYNIFHNNINTQILIANSHSYDRYTPYPNSKKVYAYQIIIDFFFDDDKPVLIKPHPEAADMFNNYFPKEIIMDGNYPLDVILLDDEAHFYKALTIRSAAIRIMEQNIADHTMKFGLEILDISGCIYQNYVALKILETMTKYQYVLKQNIFHSDDIIKYLANKLDISLSDSSVSRTAFTINKSLIDLEKTIQDYDDNSVHIILNLDEKDYHMLSYETQKLLITIKISVRKTNNESLAEEFDTVIYAYTKNKKEHKNIIKFKGEKCSKYSNSIIKYEICDLIPCSKYYSHDQKIINDVTTYNLDLKLALKNKDEIKISTLMSNEIKIPDGETYSYFANAYLNGLGVEIDINKAICYYREAIYLSNDSIKMQLVQALINRNYKNDYNEAFSITKNKHIKGDDNATIVLSDMYLKGIGTDANIDTCIKLLKTLVNKNKKGITPLIDALIIRNKESDLKEAFNLCKTQSAHNESSGIDYKLSLMYFNGQGTDKNISMAIKYMRKSSDAGYWRATRDLPDLLIKSNDVEDLRIVYDLCTKKSSEGDAHSTLLLSIMYRDGIYIPINNEMHLELLKKAAHMGDKKAILELKKMSIPKTRRLYSKVIGKGKNMDDHCSAYSNLNIEITPQFKKNITIAKSTYNYDKSLINVSTRNIPFDDFDNIDDGRNKITYNNTVFETFFKKQNGDYLYVFLTGYREKEGTRNPDFSRWSWYPVVPGSILCIDNPMYYSFPKIRMGWFLGDDKSDYIKYTSEIIKKIADILNIDNKNIIIYGSSAAGTAAIHISEIIEKSISVSINMQILPYIDSEKKKDFEDAVGIKLDTLGKRADTGHILDNSKNKHFLIINGNSDEDLKSILKYNIDRNHNIKFGFNKIDNIYIWIYYATGIPGGLKAHSAFEDRTMFTAINYITKSLINNDNIENELFDIFSEFWSDRYEREASIMMKTVEMLLLSTDENSKKKAFEICCVNRGNSAGMKKLIEMYSEGIGTPIDYDKAIDQIKILIQIENGHELQYAKLLMLKGDVTNIELFKNLIHSLSKNNLKNLLKFSNMCHSKQYLELIEKELKLDKC